MQGNLTMYTNPLPGSGVLLAFILNILDGHLPHKSEDKSKNDFKDPLTYHRIVEAFKFAFAQRAKLGDPAFQPQVLRVSPIYPNFYKILNPIAYNKEMVYREGKLRTNKDIDIFKIQYLIRKW